MQTDIKTIHDFFQRYQQTAFEKDISGMINLYDEHVVIFDMWDKGFTYGLNEWSVIITDWLSSLKEERVSVMFEMTEVNEGEELGFASALIRYQAIAPDNSILRSMKNRITIGFAKKQGSWKVKHQHTSAPVDTNLTAILDI